MKKKYQKKLLKGFSIGIFTSAFILFLFSSLFSYNKETSVLGAVLLCISLILWIHAQTNQEDIIKYRKKWLIWPIKIIIPLTLSVLLIQGDFRSWILVFTSSLVVWFLI